MTTMTNHPRHRADIDAALAARSVDQIIAAVDAGHTMAGMPLTDSDKDALRRIDRGESTTDQERRRILDEIAADRDSETPTRQ